MHHTLLDRRRFLGLTAATTAVLAFPAIVHAGRGERIIAMQNLHTGESLKTVYWAGGSYVEEGLAEIDRVLRDHRSNQVGEMDPRLIDQLHRLRHVTGSRAPFHIISGYRSPKTNAMLRTASTGVAKKSFHMKGQAVDIRLPGFDTGKLRKAARSMKAGGVGYYPRSDFIHIDTGRVRSW